MSPDQTKDALRVARVPPKDFEAAVESDSPPTITELAERGTRKVTPLVDIQGRDPAEYNRATHVRGAIADLAVMLGHVEPAAIVRGCVSRQLPDLRKNASRLVRRSGGDASRHDAGREERPPPGEVRAREGCAR